MRNILKSWKQDKAVPNYYWTPDDNTVMYFKWNQLDIIQDATLDSLWTAEENCRLFTRTSWSSWQWTIQRPNTVTDWRNIKFVSCWMKLNQAPKQGSLQTQSAYCNQWWIRIDFEHGTVWRYDCFEYRASGWRPRGSLLWLQWNVWYHFAYWIDADNHWFYYVNWVRTQLFTVSYWTENKREYLRIDDNTFEIRVWDSFFSKVSPTDEEIVDYFNRSKVLYWYN